MWCGNFQQEKSCFFLFLLSTLLSSGAAFRSIFTWSWMELSINGADAGERMNGMQRSACWSFSDGAIRHGAVMLSEQVNPCYAPVLQCTMESTIYFSAIWQREVMEPRRSSIATRCWTWRSLETWTALLDQHHGRRIMMLLRCLSWRTGDGVLCLTKRQLQIKQLDFILLFFFVCLASHFL